LQEQAKFGNDNIPYLYHLFKYCLKGQSLADWNTITSGRNRDNMTLDTYSDKNIDRFIKYHDSCNNEDLIFRKTGRKIRDELSIDELAHQYFDIHHEQDHPSADNSNNNCNNNCNSKNSNPSSNGNHNGSKLKADDPCPLHNGSHKCDTDAL
jgi:hypothetical protein